MHIAELSFAHRVAGASREDADQAVMGFVIALESNGQVCDRELTIAHARSGYKAIVGLPEPDALRPSLYSKEVRSTLRRLRTLGVAGPEERLLGEEVDAASVCRCRKRSSLILETAHLSKESPVHCADCWGVVPLYRFGHTSKRGDYDDIRYWVHRYRCLDSLWTQSGVGERFAYRELSDYDSDLSRTGRNVCRRIEKQSGTRTYYYLYRWFGRSIAAERRRKCPGCGGNWLLDEPWGGWYDFRCDRCRLVSNVSPDVR